MCLQRHLSVPICWGTLEPSTVPSSGQERLSWEGTEGCELWSSYILWVDQRQRSYKVGKRKLKLYHSKNTWIRSSSYHCQKSCKALGDVTFLARCYQILKGQGLGGVRKEEVTLKPFALFVSRKGRIKDVIQEFSLCFVLYAHGFLCMSSVLCAPSLGALSPFKWSR